MVASGPFSGLASNREKRELLLISRKKVGAKKHSLSPARLGDFPAALLGNSDTDRLLRCLWGGSGAGNSASVTLPSDVPFTGKGGSPLTENRLFLEVACPKCKSGAPAETDTWTPLSILPGTFCASSRHRRIRYRLLPRKHVTGCRWTNTSAESSTRCSIFFMRGSSPRL